MDVRPRYAVLTDLIPWLLLRDVLQRVQSLPFLLFVDRLDQPKHVIDRAIDAK